MTRRQIRADQLHLQQPVAAIDGQELQPHGEQWPWVTSINLHKQPGQVFVALSWSPWSALVDADTPITVIHT